MRYAKLVRTLGWVMISIHAAGAAPAAARATGLPRIFPQLSLSRTRIAFALAGDLWLVPRAGGAAVQLTSGPENDSYPSFSPDGAWIAFSRAVGGDADVYILPVEGGTPARLTFHPAPEFVRGWSQNGTQILFTAARGMSWQSRLYTVPADGGPSHELPIPIAWNGVFAPDGRIVYAPREVIGRYATSWRGYRGGSMGALEIADLRAGTFTPLSSDQGNDRLPVWAGDRLLIASDRADGLYNICSLDVTTGRASPITHFRGTGIGALAGSPDGAAAYERDGSVFLLDPATGRSQPVPIALAADRGEIVERQVAAGDYIDGAQVGANGDVAVVARGDIFLVDGAGHARNLTASSSVTEQAPAFSADGRRLAYVSFGAGGDALVLQDLARPSSRRTIALPRARGGFFETQWSPDGRCLVVTDFRAGLWLVDAITGSSRMIDAGTHMNDYSFEVAWSPDGQWLAYARHLPNNNRALFLQHVAGGPKYQLTSGEVDTGSPTFDRGGRQIDFIASGSAAAAEAFGMYPAILRPLVLRRIQVAAVDLSQSPDALRRSLSPAAFALRIRTLPFEASDYGAITVLADSTLFVSARQWPATPGRGRATLALFRLDNRSPEPAMVASDVDRFALSPDRTRLLVNSGDNWSVRPLPAGTGGTTFSLADVRLTVKPKDEWRQIYREAWREMRDTFYDPAHHGQDIAALEERYARYLPGITRRADLNALLYLALGNVSVSHIAIDGGDNGAKVSPPPASGLLGADLAIDAGRFRFTRILPGCPFAAESIPAGVFDGLDAPVKAGDYLLRINGVEATADRDLQFYLLGTAGRLTTLTVAETPDGRGARTITVQPLASDAPLREAAWIEGNRAIVDARSNGTLAYVYIPDYQERGMAAFLRQWTAASDKDGVVIDQRYNPGGWAADFILDLVSRRPLSYYTFRDARDLPFPVISNAGPRALLVNERNGSAADTFPWVFQRAGVGPIVGHRTAGWGVGHLSQITFADGGALSLPLRAFFNPDGRWDIENHGVSPDIRAEIDPAGALRGEDAQLNAAIDAVLALRKERPISAPRHPEPLVYPPEAAH